MNANQAVSHPTGRAVARAGAAVGVGLTFAYALTFALYAIVRSSWTIWRWTPPDLGKLEALAANAASIVVASVASAGLLAVVVALLSMGTALVMAWALATWNAHQSTGRAILMGAATALVVVVVGQFTLSWALGRSLFSFGAATYLFWIGLPSLLYVGAGGVLARWLTQPALATPQPPARRPTDGALAAQHG
jgi:hypothetical protein